MSQTFRESLKLAAKLEKSAIIVNLNQPVDWDNCVYCGGRFESDDVECRVWGMKDRRVGVAHQSCATLEALKG
jgi:hypothetical protein